MSSTLEQLDEIVIKWMCRQALKKLPPMDSLVWDRMENFPIPETPHFTEPMYWHDPVIKPAMDLYNRIGTYTCH